jgi:hypothetical protein
MIGSGDRRFIRNLYISLKCYYHNYNLHVFLMRWDNIDNNFIADKIDLDFNNSDLKEVI